MKKIFSEPAELERIAKEKYCIPDFLMMEHAASFMKDFILKIAEEKNLSKPSVLIICGKGNNGGDGYALARLLAGHAEISVFQLFETSGKEAKTQAAMCKKLNIPITDKSQAFKQINKLGSKDFQPDFIIDCIFGTLSTLIAVILICFINNFFIASLMPTLTSIIVVLELYFVLELPFLLTLIEVMGSMFVIESIIGYTMFRLLIKNKNFLRIIKNERKEFMDNEI